MKKIIVIVALILIAIVVMSRLQCNKNLFDLSAYKVRIDSLQKNIDSVSKLNDLEELKIADLQQKNDSLVEVKNDLEQEIDDLKKDTEYIEIVREYNPTQVDSFFKNKYANEYKIVQKDTVLIPLPVAQSAVVDIIDLEKTKKVLVKTDSLVTVLNKTNENKDTIIVSLRTKEANYNTIIFNKDAQMSEWKNQLFISQMENKKLKIKNKFGKIVTYVLLGGLAYSVLK